MADQPKLPVNLPHDSSTNPALLALRGRLTLITGGPGTGKTTTVVRVLALLQHQAIAAGAPPLRLRLAAPTGKAAARLSESLESARQRLVGLAPDEVLTHIPLTVSTVHRLLGSRPDSRHFRHHREAPLHADVVVVDEASMIDLEMMAALLDALPEHARLILLGDKDQLASVEAGAVLGQLCAHADAGGYRPDTLNWLAAAADGADLAPYAARPELAAPPLADCTVMLRHSHRFDASSGIGHMITDSQSLLNTGQIIFGIIVIGLIGLVSDFAFKALNHRLFAWSFVR